MGFWNKNSGYESPLVLAAGAAALCETGPGAYSVDALVGLSVSAGLRLALLGLAVVGGLVALAVQKSVAREGAASA